MAIKEYTTAQVFGHRHYIYAADKHASLVDLATCSTVRGRARYRVIQFPLLIGCNNSLFYLVKVLFSSGVDSYTCTQPELYFACYSK